MLYACVRARAWAGVLLLFRMVVCAFVCACVLMYTSLYRMSLTPKALNSQCPSFDDADP